MWFVPLDLATDRSIRHKSALWRNICTQASSQKFPTLRKQKFYRSAIMAEEIHHFNLIFDLLYTQENVNNISNENSQKVEKEKRFSDLTEEQKFNFLLIWKRKRPKVQINGVVKVFKGTNTNKHFIDYQKLKETLEI